jgi:Protein of unknown function (DUF4031)
MPAAQRGSSERREGHDARRALALVTVYLDDWRQPATLGPVADRWSHLLADSDDELHAFAERLGLRRGWFQCRGDRRHHAHYDLPERSRPDALALGAVEVTWREVGMMMRERRRTLREQDAARVASGLVGANATSPVR